MKGKQKHLTADEIKEKYRIKAIVAEEMRLQRQELVLEDEIIATIKATHTADMTMQAVVLIDHFGADKEWVLNFMELQKELLMQYDAGEVQVNQMIEHVKLACGLDIEEYTNQIMKVTKVDNKKQG